MTSAVNARTEIVFIENNVADYQALLSGLNPALEVHILEASGDGLAQMATALLHNSSVG